jgi:hypothetical protein
MQVKGPPVHLPYIIHILQQQKVPFQLPQLLILDPREGSDGHSVVDVEPKGVERVVNDDYLAEVSVEDAEVFDVGEFLAVEVAVGAIETVLDVLLLGVDMLQNVIGVAFHG